MGSGRIFGVILLMESGQGMEPYFDLIDKRIECLGRRGGGRRDDFTIVFNIQWGSQEQRMSDGR